MTPVYTFDEREMNEIKFALFYVRECHHGTAGHNRLLLIARMAKMLGMDHQYGDWELPDNVLVLDKDGYPAGGYK